MMWAVAGLGFDRMSIDKRCEGEVINGTGHSKGEPDPASRYGIEREVASGSNRRGPVVTWIGKPSGRNFCWLHLPKEASHGHLRVKADPETREVEIQAFEDTSLYVRPFQRAQITLKLAARRTGHWMREALNRLEPARSGCR